MPHFKVPNDSSPHYLPEGVEPGVYLPAGFELITDAQAEAMRHPPETRDQAVRRARRDLKTLYQPALDKLDWMQLGYVTTGDTSDALAVETFKVGLRALMKSDFTGCVDYAAMKAQARGTYNGLVATTPQAVVAKFRDLMEDDKE